MDLGFGFFYFFRLVFFCSTKTVVLFWQFRFVFKSCSLNFTFICEKKERKMYYLLDDLSENLHFYILARNL